MNDPLHSFLRTLGDDQPGGERLAIALGLQSFSQPAGLHFDLLNARLFGQTSPSTSRDQGGAGAIFHLFWSLVPDRIFQPGEPNYKRLAEVALEAAGMSEAGGAVSRSLTVVFKRLRQHHFDGRDATSLDLSRTDHDQVLNSQGGRCGSCGYRFVKADIDLYLEDEVALRAPHMGVVEGELLLDSIMRAPVLDHILPVFLAGDAPPNWQILCRTCNAGKGEIWSSAVRGSAPPRTPAQVLALRPMLRYLVLAERIRESGAPLVERHIVKRRTEGLVTLHNLKAVDGPR